jgi:hypothetical protein
MPATMSAIYKTEDAKMVDGDSVEVAVDETAKPSKMSPQKAPPMITRIEPISEVIAMPSW